MSVSFKYESPSWIQESRKRFTLVGRCSCGALCVFVFPSGAAENGIPPLTPGVRRTEIATDVDPLMEGDPHRIERLNVLRQPVDGRFGHVFWFKGAKQAVPDNQRPSMVAIQVAQIGTVMNAVMGRRIEHRLQRTERTYQFRMNPELIEQADGLHGHDHHWLEANQGQPEPKDERKREPARPRLPQRGAQVIALGRMMHDVRCPEEAAFMAGAVRDVVAEIVGEEERNPGPPLVANVENSKPMYEGVKAEDEQFCCEANNHIANTHGEAGCCVLELEQIAVHPPCGDCFEQKQEKETRNRELNQVGH